MLSITKFFRFEAAHRLPNYNGKCSNLHGHSYKLEVEVSGLVDEDSDVADEGMVMDFGVLKEKVVDAVVWPFDHTDLNEKFKNPTAECMVQWIKRELEKQMPSYANLVRVRLWETADSYAEWKK